MNSYQNELRIRVELRKLQDARKKEVIPEKPGELDYLGTIRRWWATLAPTSRAVGWSLEVIQAAAFAKSHRPPASRRVAQALRSLGFVMRRTWRVDQEGRRLWYPPAVLKTN